MKIIALGSIVFGVAAQAMGQSIVPGSKAPSLGKLEPVLGWSAKSPTGRVSVIEFWATWCGPCIEAMPHLSDLADRYKGKVDFLSINVRDRLIRNGKPEPRADQVKRITAWAKARQNTIRYPLALDDEKETTYKNWLLASGSIGIPRVFIIDEKGTIAWVGSPGKLEAALNGVLSGTNDINENKKLLQKELNSRQELDLAREAFREPIKNADANGFDSVLGRTYALPVSLLEFGLQNAALQNPPFGLDRLKHYAKKSKDLQNNEICMIAGMIAQNSKDVKIREEALRISATAARDNRDEFRIYGYWYHARTLHFIGDKKGRDQWLEEVTNLKSTISESRWNSLQKSIQKEIGAN